MKEDRQIYLNTLNELDKLQTSYHEFSLFEKLVVNQSFEDLMKELTYREPGKLSHIGHIVRIMRADGWLWRGKKVTFEDHVNLLEYMFSECKREMNINNRGYHVMSTGGWTMEVDAYKGTVRVNFNIFDNIIQPDSEGFFERDE